MNIYAIGDLHLSGDPPSKPMEIFGDHWAGHKEKIKNNWLQTVHEDDVVIICGDISWAMGLENVAEDLAWLKELPGRKLLLRGNHDYWWTSLKKMQAAYGKDFEFIQNNCTMIGDVAICGTRGWILPTAESFTEEDKKIYEREAIRLKMSLDDAKKANAKEIICALHYPPLFAPEEESLFTNLLEEYGVKHCIYGHIHGLDHVLTFEGERKGVNYKLTSCDTQEFKLYEILSTDTKTI
ncbi:MAG: metallophosphoesterase [Phascolarctobacterium sp.]|nr:metallophosphoesterase [Phascolarctobacterium sp.]